MIDITNKTLLIWGQDSLLYVWYIILGKGIGVTYQIGAYFNIFYLLCCFYWYGIIFITLSNAWYDITDINKFYRLIVFLI